MVLGKKTGGIIEKYIKKGIAGWRLDVADELPDKFLDALSNAVKAEKADAYILGEVWEDGTTKIAYDVRRKHLLGGHCDGLMNYPFRTALLDYLQGRGAQQFVERMETLRENYPTFAFYSAMNALGTHDTLRVLTLLGAGGTHMDKTKDWRAAHRMTPYERQFGKELLKVGAAVLFCFPGSPTVYYGDEAGMEGFEDPFNRRTFPWGNEDKELTDWFARLGNLRKKSPAAGGTALAGRRRRCAGLYPQRNGREHSVCLQRGRGGADLASAGGAVDDLAGARKL